MRLLKVSNNFVNYETRLELFNYLKTKFKSEEECWKEQTLYNHGYRKPLVVISFLLLLDCISCMISLGFHFVPLLYF